MMALDIAYAALIQMGRPDLAEYIVGIDAQDGHGFYLEVDGGDDLSEHDWDLVDRAETLARHFIGLPPFTRWGPDGYG